MHETLRWVYEPILVKLFFIYLTVVICIATVRSMKVTYRLFSLPFRARIPSQNFRDGVVNAESLAQSALANAVSDESTVGEIRRESGSQDITQQTDRQKVAMRTVRAAESRFSYLWEMCHTRIKSMKRLVLLTFLMSFLILGLGFVPAWSSEFENTNLTGIQALYMAIPELLARLTLGVSVCTALYGAASFFEGVLERRKAHWSYVIGRLKDEISAE